MLIGGREPLKLFKGRAMTVYCDFNNNFYSGLGIRHKQN